MDDYNNNHPHESLNDMSPVKFLKSKFKEKMPAFTVQEKGVIFTVSPTESRSDYKKTTGFIVI